MEAVREIVETYERYGWVLRLIIVGPNTVLPKQELREFGVDVTDAEIDAAWFSRPPQPGEVAWEIRYLGTPAFSLVEHMDENSDDLDDRLRAVEARLLEKVASKRLS